MLHSHSWETRAIDDIISEYGLQVSRPQLLSCFYEFSHALRHFDVLKVPRSLKMKSLCHTKCSNQAVFAIFGSVPSFLTSYHAAITQKCCSSGEIPTLTTKFHMHTLFWSTIRRFISTWFWFDFTKCKNLDRAKIFRLCGFDFSTETEWMNVRVFKEEAWHYSEREKFCVCLVV